MQILAHFQKNRLEGFINDLALLSNQYLAQDFGVDRSLMLQFEPAEAYFKQIGKSSLASEVNNLKLYLNTALTGINPITLELVRKERRKIIRASTFHCLSKLNAIVETELKRIELLLAANIKLIQQIMISLLQAKLITEVQLQQINNMQAVEAFWEKLKSSSEQVALINKKMRLEILNQDIILLLDQTIEKLK